MYYLLLLVLPVVAAQAPAACEAAPNSCTANLISPQPAGTICGKTGNLSSPSYLSQCSYSSLQNCRAFCLGNTACASFSWDSQNGRCETYTKPVAGMKFTAASNTRQVFGKGCYSFTCTAASTMPSTASGLSVGFGGGTDIGKDIYYSGSTANVSIAEANAYCGTGAFCKQYDFGTGESHYVYLLPTISVPSTGKNFTLRATASARKLYQNNSCIISVYGDFIKADGSSTEAFTSPGKEAGWGVHATDVAVTNGDIGGPKLSIYIHVGCGQSPDGRTQKLWLDDITLTQT